MTRLECRISSTGKTTCCNSTVTFVEKRGVPVESCMVCQQTVVGGSPTGRIINEEDSRKEASQ